MYELYFSNLCQYCVTLKKEIDRTPAVQSKVKQIDVMKSPESLPSFVSTVPLIVDLETQQMYKGDAAFKMVRHIAEHVVDNGPENYDITYKGVMYSDIESQAFETKHCENFSFITNSGQDIASGSGIAKQSDEIDQLMAQRNADIPSFSRVG